MDYHNKIIFWPTTPKPNCILCPNNTVDTWAHLLLTCTNQHIKGLQIARHNKAIHQISTCYNPTYTLAIT